MQFFFVFDELGYFPVAQVKVECLFQGVWAVLVPWLEYTLGLVEFYLCFSFLSQGQVPYRELLCSGFSDKKASLEARLCLHLYRLHFPRRLDVICMHKKLRVSSIAHIGTLFEELLETDPLSPSSQVLIASKRNFVADNLQPEILSLI